MGTSIRGPQPPDKALKPSGTNGQVVKTVGGVSVWADETGGGAGDPTMGGDLTGTASAAQIAAGVIVDADVSGAAAIAPSKIAPGSSTQVLTTTGGVAGWSAAPTNPPLSGDVTGTASANQIASGVIVNADVNASAGIAPSKLAAGTNGQVITTVAGVPAWSSSGAGDPAMGGDLTGTASSAQIAAGAIVNADVSATAGLSVTKLAPGTNGQVLTTTGGAVAWGSGSGSPTVPWVLNVKDHGAAGDAKTSVAGCTIAFNSNTATVTSAGFVNGDIGKTFVFLDGNSISSPRRTRTIASRISSTQITFSGPAATTGCSGQPAAWGTDDSAAISATIALASAANGGTTIIGYPPGLYLCASTVDATPEGLYHQGLGGKCHVATDGTTTVGGAMLLACMQTAGTLFNSDRFGLGVSGQITHAGINIERLFFHDPLMKRDQRFVAIGAQTRHRVVNCGFYHGDVGLEYLSGSKDVSWGQAFYNSFIKNDVGIKTTNHIGVDIGAMALEIWGGQFNVFAGQIGLWHRGGQYMRTGYYKIDQDGEGSVGIRFDDSAFGSSPGNSIIEGVTCEHTADTMVLDTGHTIEIMGGTAIDGGGTGGGVGNVIVSNCSFGGGTGGGGGHGVGVYIEGTTSGRVTSCEVNNCNFTNYATAIHFGAFAMRCSAQKCSVSNAAVANVNWATNSTDCRVAAIDVDQTSFTNANAKMLHTSGTRPYYYDLRWSGGACMYPTFPGAVPSGFGSDGDLAYNGTALHRKFTTWAAV